MKGLCYYMNFVKYCESGITNYIQISKIILLLPIRKGSNMKMNIATRTTKQLVIVLNTLVELGEPATGYRIMKEARLKSGVVYPILGRLVENEILSIFENELNGRNRRLFKLTKKGALYTDEVNRIFALKTAKEELRRKNSKRGNIHGGSGLLTS